MRVLLIANTLPPTDLSGVGEQVLQLATGLRANGHEVEILGRGGDGARGGKGAFPLRIVAPALARIEAFAPDVVQLHESDGGLLARRLAARSASRGVLPRLVALLQVSYVEERRSVRALRHGGELLGRPGAVERRFRWLKAPLQILLGRWTAAAADVVLAPSAATARELERDYSARDVRVVPNASGGWPVGERPIADLDSGEAGARPLLYVGRLRIRKGVEVLLRALASRNAGSSTPELWIVGEGEHREAVEAAAERFGVRGRVRFLGRRSAEEIRWALARASALVVPSIYEGMPLVILEAMATGTPVVASRVSGIPEVVLDGETGWLVPPEDPPALAAALAEARGSRAEAVRRGENGRRRFESSYRPERVARIWEAAVVATERGGEGPN
jgi:glycosyltransferase involved in cell wall biosynthesis